MRDLALVGLGSAIGGVARHLVGAWVTAVAGTAFPWGTVVANVSGCLTIGFLGGIALAKGRAVLSPELQLLLMTGFCGGYTTFSAFALQTLVLARDGSTIAAVGNVVLSVVACLAAVWIGAALARLV